MAERAAMRRLLDERRRDIVCPGNSVTRALTVCFLVAAGCGGEPEVVFVPAESFREELYVSARRGMRVTVDVDEPVQLHAQRRSGPWTAVDARSVPEGGCSLRTPPPQLEGEVAGNVRWLVEPEGTARFEVVATPDRPREVRFDAPGTYRITAETPSWCGDPFTSNSIVVEVRG